jgi:hypothetical protein
MGLLFRHFPGHGQFLDHRIDVRHATHHASGCGPFLLGITCMRTCCSIGHRPVLTEADGSELSFTRLQGGYIISAMAREAAWQLVVMFLLPPTDRTGDLVPEKPFSRNFWFYPLYTGRIELLTSLSPFRRSALLNELQV